MDTLCTESIPYGPDVVKVYDVRRPGVWCLFEVTWQGVRLVETSGNVSGGMVAQAQQLAALAV